MLAQERGSPAIGNVAWGKSHKEQSKSDQRESNRMDPHDISRLSQAIARTPLSWISEQIREHIAQGQLVEESKPTLTQRPEEYWADSSGPATAERFREGPKKRFTATKPFTEEEAALITLDAVEQVLENGPRMADEVIKFVRPAIHTIEFVDEDGRDVVVIDMSDVDQLEAVAQRSKVILDQLRRS